jgi:phosphoribosyl 1,2-cyclic phosphodiesterase
LIEAGQLFRIGGLEVDAFAVPHDAVDPMGFSFTWEGARLAVLTDLGHPTTLVAEKARGAHTIVIEANYDDALLAADTRRPWATKQRIASRHGHLSNAQAAELIGRLRPHGLARVILAHLSKDCNSPEAARRALSEFPELEILCAGQDEPTAHLEVRPVEGAGDSVAGIRPIE